MMCNWTSPVHLITLRPSLHNDLVFYASTAIFSSRLPVFLSLYHRRRWYLAIFTSPSPSRGIHLGAATDRNICCGDPSASYPNNITHPGDVASDSCTQEQPRSVTFLTNLRTSYTNGACHPRRFAARSCFLHRCVHLSVVIFRFLPIIYKYYDARINLYGRACEKWKILTAERSANGSLLNK